MFHDLNQIKEYIQVKKASGDPVIQAIQYPNQAQWKMALKSSAKKRFIQAALATALMADGILTTEGIPIVQDLDGPKF